MCFFVMTNLPCDIFPFQAAAETHTLVYDSDTCLQVSYTLDRIHKSKAFQLYHILPDTERSTKYQFQTFQTVLCQCI